MNRIHAITSSFCVFLSIALSHCLYIATGKCAGRVISVWGNVWHHQSFNPFSRFCPVYWITCTVTESSCKHIHCAEANEDYSVCLSSARRQRKQNSVIGAEWHPVWPQRKSRSLHYERSERNARRCWVQARVRLEAKRPQLRFGLTKAR